MPLATNQTPRITITASRLSPGRRMTTIPAITPSSPSTTRSTRAGVSPPPMNASAMPSAPRTIRFSPAISASASSVISG